LGGGVPGFDDITGGGLPEGRVTVVTGGPGTGKTVFALQMLARGGDGGAAVFVAFEESAARVLEYATNFGWSLAGGERKVSVLDAQLRQSVAVSGTFDVLGLLALLEAECRRIGATRIVLDGIDVLLAWLADPVAIRREVFRLREWLVDRGITAIVTVKSIGLTDEAAHQYEYLQYMADCVVVLQHRTVQRTALRSLRVSKFRGGSHSGNEFPFVITDSGIQVASITLPEVDHRVSDERVGTGVTRLDAMLDGGYYRGSSVLISGAPGTAKTTLGATFAAAACARGERTLLVSFDEAPDQIVRDLASVGCDLASYVVAGTLRICSLRARAANPDFHVWRVRRELEEHGARNLVVDPLSAFSRAVDQLTAEDAAVHLLDVAKRLGITFVSTTLLATAQPLDELTAIAVSTLADTWIHLSYVNQGGERNRALTIVKSRGMGHSNQVRELVLSDRGVTLSDVYTAGGEVLMGTLRWEKENERRRTAEAARRETEQSRQRAEARLAELATRIEALHQQQVLERAELELIDSYAATDVSVRGTQREDLLRLRGGGTAEAEGDTRRGPR
jgi:circadian clock protein KaiC